MAGYTPDYDDTGSGGDFDLMPKGIYPVQCVKAEERPTKDGNGSYFNLQWEVQGDFQAGRMLFSMITWENKSQKAVDIGRQNLNAICKLNGMGKNGGQVNLPEDLVMAKIWVIVGTDTYNGETKNVIKGYRLEAPQQKPGQSLRTQGASMGAAPAAAGRSLDDDEPPF